MLTAARDRSSPDATMCRSVDEDAICFGVIRQEHKLRPRAPRASSARCARVHSCPRWRTPRRGARQAALGLFLRPCLRKPSLPILHIIPAVLIGAVAVHRPPPLSRSRPDRCAPRPRLSWGSRALPRHRLRHQANADRGRSRRCATTDRARARWCAGAGDFDTSSASGTGTSAAFSIEPSSRSPRHWSRLAQPSQAEMCASSSASCLRGEADSSRLD